MVKYYYRYRVSHILLDSRGIYRGIVGKYIITDTGYPIYCWTPEEFTEEMMVNIITDTGYPIYCWTPEEFTEEMMVNIITDTGYPIYCWTPEEFTEEMMVNILLQIQGIPYTAGLPRNLPRK